MTFEFDAIRSHAASANSVNSCGRIEPCGHILKSHLPITSGQQVGSTVTEAAPRERDTSSRAEISRARLWTLRGACRSRVPGLSPSVWTVRVLVDHPSDPRRIRKVSSQTGWDRRGWIRADGG